MTLLLYPFRYFEVKEIKHFTIMKNKNLLLTLSGLFLVLASSCSDDDSTIMNEEMMPMEEPVSANFTVTIENVTTPKPIFQTGVFSIPVGGMDPAPIFPEDAYEFMVNAGPVVVPGDGGTRLSFVAMFVQSNDLFFAPNEEGIALYDENGTAIGSNGTPTDVTNQVFIWDSGTEVNEETGGPNQKPQQSATAEDQGIDENGVVTQIMNNIDSFGNTIPNTNEVIKVTVENVGDAMFKVRIENVSNSTTIATPGQGVGSMAPVPVSPGVYSVHTVNAPFFVAGEVASGAGSIASAEGVENIAEDGFPEALFIDGDAATGLIVPLSPGAWATHKTGTQPIYQLNEPDFGEGVEGIAEDGDPSTLAATLISKAGVSDSGTFDTGVGSANPGAIGPGGSFQFSFTAIEDENLSLATMFVQSNDWFYAFNPSGLPLFNNGIALSGDLTESIFLYDAGTELDEYAGAGLFQVIRQPSTNSGTVDTDTNVRLISPSGNIPANSNVIKVSITASSN